MQSRQYFQIGVVILVLAGCALSPQAKEAKYLKNGKTAFEKKDYAAAAVYFKNAIAAQPRDAAPYYQLGLAQLAVGDVNAAAANLHKACELKPQFAAAQIVLAGLMASSNSKTGIEEAEERVRNVLAGRPDDVDALRVLAAIDTRLGRFDDAEAHLEQVLRKSPASVGSSLALARIRLGRKNAAGAEEALKRAVVADPKSPDARVHLAGFYIGQGRTAEAEQQLREALTADPKNGSALLNLADLQVRMGRTDEAAETYRRISALQEKQYRPVYAAFLFQSGKRDEAIAELEKLFGADTSDRNVRTELVQAYLALNRVNDAIRVLTSALKKNGRDVDALLQRSRVYLTSGKLDEAQSDLNQVLHYRGALAEAHYLLAQVGKARENTAVQKLELGETLRLEPQFLTARTELARLLLAGGAADAALKLLDETPAHQGQDPGVILQRNWALLALGRRADARAGVDQSLSAGHSVEALMQDAVLKLGAKDYAKARASAEAALLGNPEEARALELLVQTYAAQNQRAAGIQRAREYAARNPAAAIQVVVGRLLLADGDGVGARKAFENAIAANPGMLEAELPLGEIDASEGKRDAALKRVSAVVASHPRNVLARLFLAQLEIGDGKKDRALEQYRKALEVDDKNALALNGAAYLLSETGQADEALKYAQRAKEVLPDNADVDDTLGWTYFQKGMYALAVTQLESAIRRKEGNAVWKYHLAMAYLKAGDPKRGRETLDAALKMNPGLPEAQAARQAFGISPK